MKMNVLHKDLTRRYLIWAYKTTRESFERIERKTTQLKVDEFILNNINHPKESLLKKDEYQRLVGEFKKYIINKKKEELDQKFSDSKKKSYHPQYLYFKNRLSAIEKAIEHFLGKIELKSIEALYEKEFINRILQAREH